MTIINKAYSAVRWTSFAAFLRAFLQIAQVAILARLLSADDYGLIAMVGVVLSFAGLFSDLGVNSAYLQRSDITPEQRSSLFWLNIMFSLLVTAGVLLFSPLLVAFFGDDRLASLLILISPTFLIVALGQQLKMSAEKELNFRPVMLIEVFSAFAGFALASICAYLGFGAYSLVASALVSAACGTFFAWIYLAKDWRPMLHFHIAEVKPFLGFGGGVVVSNMANQVSMTVDLLLGGRLLTASQLGLYSLPRNLSLQIQLIVNPIITRVGFPLIAQVQSDVHKVKAVYLKTLSMTSAVNAPIYMGLAFFSLEIVQVLLGDRWTQSVELLKIFALWGSIRSIGNPSGSLLFGLGRSDLAMKWNVGFMCLAPIVMWIGSLNGPTGLAWGLVSFAAVQFFAGWLLIAKPLCDLQFIEYCIASLKPFFFSGLSSGVAYFFASYIQSTVLRLVIGGLCALIIYMAMSYLFNREWFFSMMALLGKKSR